MDKAVTIQLLNETLRNLIQIREQVWGKPTLKNKVPIDKEIERLEFLITRLAIEEYGPETHPPGQSG
jgi:hypothetical protein